MGAYDVFLYTEHNDFIQRTLLKNNIRLIKWIKRKYFSNQDLIKMLEIGPGKGYVHEACITLGGIDYYAADRNASILKNLNLSDDRVISGELPHIEIPDKMDIIFVGYVIEHLESGIQLYESINLMKENLTDDGIIILLFPDAMKLGMEFWNIDYTHSFPTTKRNVNQCVIDCGMYVDEWADLSGVLYSPRICNRHLNRIRRFITSLYSYHFFSFITGPFYRKPLWDLSNVFWRFYAMTKEYNVMFGKRSIFRC